MQSVVEVEMELVVERVRLDNQSLSAALPVVRNTPSCASLSVTTKSYHLNYSVTIICRSRAT